MSTLKIMKKCKIKWSVGMDAVECVVEEVVLKEVFDLKYRSFVLNRITFTY